MSANSRVVAQGDLAPESLAYLEDEGLRVDAVAPGDQEALLQAIPEADALIAAPGSAVPADVLRAGRRLTLVARPGADVADIDVAEATRRGVIVVHTPRSNVVSEAEQALAMLLACARDLARTDADLRAGRRLKGRWADSGVEVRGKTLGLVGCADGSALLAESAGALGMRVLACDPRASADALCGAPLERDESECVYGESDFIVVHLPAGAETDGVVGAGEFARMKQGVRFVSLSGPGVVDRAALLGALESGRVAAAALEVSAAGLRPGDALLAAQNVLLTAHLEASTADARRRAEMTAAEQVARVLRGEFPSGAVNVPVEAGDDAGELMPYLDLCTQLGRLVVQLAGDPVDTVHVTYGGSVAYFDTHLLTLGVLAGVLAGRADGPVNFVNAQGIADACGVGATEERQSDVPDFPRLIIVSAAGADGEVSVSGTSLGREHKPRLVRVFGEDVDIAPAPRMAFLRYVDVPGVGGKLGTLLGEWGVNIGHMSVGRGRLGNEAVMALTLDSPLSAAQIDELVEHCGLEYARAVEL